MNHLEVLVLKKSTIEGLLEVLGNVSPSIGSRSSSFLPFGVLGAKSIDLENKVVDETSKLEEGGSLQMAKQLVDSDYIAFSWLQELGSPVCELSASEIVERIAELVSNKTAICSISFTSATN